jgi:hypothetical protein
LSHVVRGSPAFRLYSPTSQARHALSPARGCLKPPAQRSHISAFVRREKRPGAHATQDALPRSTQVPGLQWNAHAGADEARSWPAGQSTHPRAPARLIVSSGHDAHLSAFIGSGWCVSYQPYLPDGHDTQRHSASS